MFGKKQSTPPPPPPPVASTPKESPPSAGQNIGPLAKYRKSFADNISSFAKDKTVKPSSSKKVAAMENAVQFTNEQLIGNSGAMIAAPADSMISNAAGIAAEASAGYYDGMTKLVMASQSVMLKKMTEDIAEENLKGAGEEALGILVTEILLAGAMAVAAAGGAMESEAAGFSIDKLNESIGKFAQAKSVLQS